jgi:phage tail protein X
VSISANSRYAASTVVSITSSETGQPVNVIVPSQQQAYTFSYISHMLTVRDRMDVLANRYFGDPTLWWQIADANPEILDWSNVAPGTVIRIPFA